MEPYSVFNTMLGPMPLRQLQQRHRSELAERLCAIIHGGDIMEIADGFKSIELPNGKSQIVMPLEQAKLLGVDDSNNNRNIVLYEGYLATKGLQLLRKNLYHTSNEEAHLIEADLFSMVDVFIQKLEGVSPVNRETMYWQILLARCSLLSAIKDSVNNLTTERQGMIKMPDKTGSYSDWSRFWKSNNSEDPVVNGILVTQSPEYRLFENYAVVNASLRGYKIETKGVVTTIFEELTGTASDTLSINTGLAVAQWNITIKDITSSMISKAISTVETGVYKFLENNMRYRLKQKVEESQDQQTTDSGLPKFLKMIEEPYVVWILRIRKSSDIIATRVTKFRDGLHTLFAPADMVVIQKECEKKKILDLLSNTRDTLKFVCGEKGFPTSFVSGGDIVYDMNKKDQPYEQSHGSMFYENKVAKLLQEQNIACMKGGNWSMLLKDCKAADGEGFMFAALLPLILTSVMKYGLKYAILSIKSPMFYYYEKDTSIYEDFRTYNLLQLGDAGFVDDNIPGDTWEVLVSNDEKDEMLRKHITS